MRSLAVLFFLPAAARAQSAIGVISSGDAKLSGTATMVPGGLQVATGTDIEAEKTPADLLLTRGGAVRVCPGSNVTVTESRDGQELQFAMGEGSIEANYFLGPHGDTFLTPDLRIVVSGPAHVDVKIGTDAAGNSCIENRGAAGPYVLISQLIGDGVYRVPPDAKLLVEGGQVERIKALPGDCGCPQLSAQTEIGLPRPRSPEPPQTSASHNSAAGAMPSGLAASSSAGADKSAPASTGQTQLQVDAPLVFNAQATGANAQATGANAQAAGANAQAAGGSTQAAVQAQAAAASNAARTQNVSSAPQIAPATAPDTPATAPAQPAKVVEGAAPASQPRQRSSGFFHAIGHFFVKLLGP